MGKEELNIEKDKIWKNNKNGNLYGVINTVINATNANDGQVMVLYTSLSKTPTSLYVRECGEFIQKFTKMEEIK